MPTYFVDDGGDGSDGSTWAKAYTNLRNLVAGVANALTTAGNIIYIGSDTDDTLGGTANHSGAYTLTGVTGPALPVSIISSTVGSGTTVSYAQGTGNQIDTSAGAYDVTFSGNIACYGLRIKSGKDILPAWGAQAYQFYSSCVFAPAANEQVILSSAYGSTGSLVNCTVDLTADGTTARSGVVLTTATGGNAEITGLNFTNSGYRTGTIFSALAGSRLLVSGCDLSGFVNATECELFAAVGAIVQANNILTKASFVALGGTTGIRSGSNYTFTNVGPEDAPTYLYNETYFGAVASSTSIYRTGGATVEGDACSWLIITTANCGEGAPLFTPWIYGRVSSTGSKTFDLYVTNDTADFTNAEVWPELEYLADADEAIWTLVTGHRATITTTPAAQTDDTTSTWNGTGPSFTYKQKLSVTATIGETGQYRARVVVGVASIASSRFMYVDPLVVVT